MPREEAVESFLAFVKEGFPKEAQLVCHKVPDVANGIELPERWCSTGAEGVLNYGKARRGLLLRMATSSRCPLLVRCGLELHSPLPSRRFRSRGTHGLVPPGDLLFEGSGER